MGGTGVEQRMGILNRAAEQQMLKPLVTHGWTASVTRQATEGEYLVIRAEKGGADHKVALLYSSATANAVYKRLDQEVEHIFTNGALYNIENYAYGIKATVEPIDGFFPLLIAWNQHLVPQVGAPAPRAREAPLVTRHITSEEPLLGIWLRLDQLQSVRLSSKLVSRRAQQAGIVLSDDAVRTKAEGVSYAIRNASDYFQKGANDSLNGRLLSYYYGALSLTFAEMLASPAGPADLDEVEGMTKQGHGLYTTLLGRTLGDLHVGALDRGFFPNWMSFLGHDVSRYPKKKAKTSSDIEQAPSGTVLRTAELFARLPEVHDLFAEVFDESPSWLVPVYDSDANPTLALRQTTRPSSTYVNLIDPSSRIGLEQIQNVSWGLSEVTITKTNDQGRWFRVRVDHPGSEYWHQALPIHHSPFLNRAAIILPTFGSAFEYRVAAFTLLYAMSIVVRYMPSLWRRIEGGDADENLALIQASLGVLERVLPEQYLESILRERVRAKQPGGW